jgi:hypothetical protein
MNCSLRPKEIVYRESQTRKLQAIKRPVNLTSLITASAKRRDSVGQALCCTQEQYALITRLPSVSTMSALRNGVYLATKKHSKPSHKPSQSDQPLTATSPNTWTPSRSRGQLIRNSAPPKLPPPLIVTLPPCHSAIRFTMESPNP